jgi:Flp pilus assembly protein TadB
MGVGGYATARAALSRADSFAKCRVMLRGPRDRPGVVGPVLICVLLVVVAGLAYGLVAAAAIAAIVLLALVWTSGQVRRRRRFRARSIDRVHPRDPPNG